MKEATAALTLAEQSIKDLMYALAEGRVEGDDYQPAEIEAFSVLNVIKEALAPTSTQCEVQPEKEPLAVMQLYASGWDLVEDVDLDWLHTLPFGTILYTAPPQRPWVGLTEDEYDEIWRMDLNNKDIMDKTIAKLKEKNT